MMRFSAQANSTSISDYLLSNLQQQWRWQPAPICTSAQREWINIHLADDRKCHRSLCDMYLLKREAAEHQIDGNKILTVSKAAESCLIYVCVCGYSVSFVCARWEKGHKIKFSDDSWQILSVTQMIFEYLAGEGHLAWQEIYHVGQIINLLPTVLYIKY